MALRGAAGIPYLPAQAVASGQGGGGCQPCQPLNPRRVAVVVFFAITDDASSCEINTMKAFVLERYGKKRALRLTAGQPASDAPAASLRHSEVGLNRFLTIKYFDNFGIPRLT